MNCEGEEMKAAVWYGKNDVRIEEVKDPLPKKGEVKLRVKACGICGSDLHEFTSGPFIIPRHPHPLTGRSGGPVILGHEFAAEVVDCGEGVTDFHPGDRVVANPLIYCGECYYCRTAQPVMCQKLGTYGFAADGAFAEFTCFPEKSLYRIPDKISNEEAALVEPLAVAVHAVKRAEVGLGDTVAIIGAGPIGLLVLQASFAAGAKEVFVVEPVEARRDLARTLGATDAIDPNSADPGKVLAEATNGLRAMVTFDCVGTQAAFDTALRTSGRRARLCIVGLSLSPIEVPFIRLWGHEKTITFSTGYDHEFPAAISLIETGRVRVRPLITKHIPLQDIVSSGFEALIRSPSEQVKILVYP